MGKITAESTIYTLMHKKIPVVEFAMTTESSEILKIIKIHNPEHLPIGVAFRDGILDRTALNSWWRERSIPVSRDGVVNLLDELGISDPKAILTKGYGLSLSDHYWVQPKGMSLRWEDINFFTNEFSSDIGDILFGAGSKNGILDFTSPDNTSDGDLKKRWKIINGKRYLIKGGSEPYFQEPLGEAAASAVMKKLGISAIPYSVKWDNGFPYSFCEDFVNENTELVPAWRIMKIKKMRSDESIYRHFVTCAEDLGIADVIPFLDKMLTADYIIANRDRHFNNFGALRNVETLEWLGMAPVYDSGSSLGYKTLTSYLKDMIYSGDSPAKPFKEKHSEQIKLVTSFDWLNADALTGLGDIAGEILKKESKFDSHKFEPERISLISLLVEERAKKIERIAAASHTMSKM